ncbi:MAG: hypothetical protein A2099_05810 [Planctomycetes bacterium GWF2_39_10]|nr:MAG: hypothetical protein A2099_05810 [Planctomycetes bacterium GWF2_39_10]
MVFQVLRNFKLKTSKGVLELYEGQTLKAQPEKVIKFVESGKLQPLPYVTDYGSLIIPHNSNRRYHYWSKGQSVCDTLKELGRCDLIPKYKSPYSDN